MNAHAVTTRHWLADDGTLRVEFESGRVATVHMENAQPVRIMWRGGTAWRRGQPVQGPASIVGQAMAAFQRFAAEGRT
jgi:hypothetical protein